MPPLSEPIIFAAVLASFGALAGLIAGLFGIGGGIIIVPALAFLYKTCGFDADTAIHAAVGVSMMTVVATSVSSYRAHAKRGGVDSGIVKNWALAVVIGAVLGSLTAHHVSGAWLSLIFSTFMALMAIYLGFVPSDLQALKSPPRAVGQKCIAFVIGFFSALIGIGGGSLSVPTLVLCRMPMHRAIGTSTVIGFLISLPAALVFITTQIAQGMGWGDAAPPHLLSFEVLAFALLAPTTIITAPWGARLSHRLDAAILRRTFALLLLVIAVKMFAGSLG